MQLDAAEPKVDDQVLQLTWGQQARCETLITGQGIDEGKWVGDAFHCNNSWGQPVVIQFTQMKVLSPEVTPPPAIETALQQALALAADNPDLVEEKAVMASLSAAVAQGPTALMHFLFPKQYLALRTLHQLNQTSEDNQGYDWRSFSGKINFFQKN